ncbi:MAG: glycoside hydrolase family 97 protein [Bryobacteraceae bacterium]|nr:glycoside hydrolase family 97 protein [Bryobacteraceae bacterium]
MSFPRSACRGLSLMFCSLVLCAVSAPAQVGKAAVTSPDGNIRALFMLAPGANGAGGGQLGYEITYRGKPVIERSKIGFDLQNQPAIGDNLLVVAATNSRIDETYSIPAGKSNPVRNQCNVLLFDLKEANAPGRKLTVEARAYNDGIAFRTIVPDQPAVKELRIANEKTQFVLASDATTYPLILRNFRTSWEDNYRTVALSGIAPELVIGLPLLTELPGVAYVAITEANIDNYAGMYLMHSGANPKALEARLSPRVDEPGLAVSGATPVATPWRVVMISNEVGRLIESQIVNNLNPPCAIADTSWVKPGKASWDWWSGPAADGVNFKVGSNTDTAKHYIDFSAKAGFEYFMFDAGWAAHGTGPNDSGADITATKADVDMPAIIAYAKSKNVKVWLWSHWTDIDRQMDQAFPLFEKWGVAGVKIDFMDRDDQWMVNFYRRVAKNAAEHHLMIDFHGAYKPDGIGRTWPNVITREGVLGLEYNKWSARVTPDHNVMLAFTRMLAGPMDYTPGGFRNATRETFEPRNLKPMVMTTRAHQLALFVVFESPFMMVSDYPGAYEGTKELPFLSAVPASWDETRVLNAKVGDSITIARRHGQEWYVGSIAGSHGAALDIPLEFLGSGDYKAETYSDAPDAGVHPTNTVVEQKNVNRATTLKAVLASGGGQAIRIRPAK